MRTQILLSLACLFAGIGLCAGQGNYMVSGRLQGISAGEVYLISAVGQPDTLATAKVVNGGFMFKGSVDGVRGVYLNIAGSNFPLLLEDAVMQLLVTPNAVTFSGGGEAWELYNEFDKIGKEYLAAQGKLEAEYASSARNAAKANDLQASMNAAYQASVDKTLALIKANPDSYTTAFVILLGAVADGEEMLRAKYELLGETARASAPGKEIAAALDRYAALAVGKPAPDFTVLNPKGETFTLHGVAANLKLLVFWASWDNASRMANPQLIALYQQFRPKNFEIVSVSLDGNAREWIRAIEQDGLIWQNGCDLQGMASPAARQYMVGSVLPYYVLIDRENNIIAKGMSTDDLRPLLADLTKKKRK